MTSFSYTGYGDLKVGKRRNGSNDFFGERPFYVQTTNGVDEVVVSEDRYLQKYSTPQVPHFFWYKRGIDWPQK